MTTHDVRHLFVRPLAIAVGTACVVAVAISSARGVSLGGSSEIPYTLHSAITIASTPLAATHGRSSQRFQSRRPRAIPDQRMGTSCSCGRGAGSDGSGSGGSSTVAAGGGGAAVSPIRGRTTVTSPIRYRKM